MKVSLSTAAWASLVSSLATALLVGWYDSRQEPVLPPAPVAGPAQAYGDYLRNPPAPKENSVFYILDGVIGDSHL